MIPIKYIVYAVSFLVLSGGGWYSLHTWHFGPLKEQARQIESLEKQLEITGSSLNICEANLTKQALDGFIEGIGALDENVTVTLDDLHT